MEWEKERRGAVKHVESHGAQEEDRPTARAGQQGDRWTLGYRHGLGGVNCGAGVNRGATLGVWVRSEEGMVRRDLGTCLMMERKRMGS